MHQAYLCYTSQVRSNFTAPGNGIRIGNFERSIPHNTATLYEPVILCNLIKALGNVVVVFANRLTVFKPQAVMITTQ